VWLDPAACTGSSPRYPLGTTTHSDTSASSRPPCASSGAATASHNQEHTRCAAVLLPSSAPTFSLTAVLVSSGNDICAVRPSPRTSVLVDKSAASYGRQNQGSGKVTFTRSGAD